MKEAPPFESLEEILALIVDGPEPDGDRAEKGSLRLELAESLPYKVPRSLKQICEDYMGAPYPNADSLAESAYEIYTRALNVYRDEIAAKNGENRRHKASWALRPTRKAIYRLLESLCQSGSKVACAHRRRLTGDLWKAIGVKPIRKGDPRPLWEELDEFHVREKDGKTYPAHPDQSLEDEIERLLLAYLKQGSYFPRVRDITLGLYNMLNEPDAPRSEDLLQVVSRWRPIDSESWNEIANEAANLLKNPECNEGDSQFLKKLLNLHLEAGSYAAWQWKDEKDFGRIRELRAIKASQTPRDDV